MGRTYSHLSLKERRRIAKWHEAKMPIAEIADRLGRDGLFCAKQLTDGSPLTPDRFIPRPL